MSETQRELVTQEEEQGISRKVMAWINRCPILPGEVVLVNFDQLPAASEGLMLSVVQGAYILQSYITGGRLCEYQFSITYRVKPGNSNDARLTADETLNAIADWAVNNRPVLGENIRVTKVKADTRAALLVPYDNGTEDRNILMTINYEVN